MHSGMGIWPALAAEAAARRSSLLTTLVFLGIMLLVRAATPMNHKPRVRFQLLCFGLYLLSLPLRAVLVNYGMEEPDAKLTVLPATVLFAVGVISVTATVLFDLVGRSSLHKLRIVRTVLSATAAIVVTLVLLHRTGVNLSSIIATSAVLTGVIGFALQETLGNVIGGIAMQLESTVSIGDWVTIGDVTGQVVEIRWRSMSVVTRNDDMVIIPNGLIAKGLILNLSRPVAWHRQWVQFDVHYRHPPNEVQKVVLEALKGIANVKQADPPPDCILFRMEQDHAHYAVRYRLLDLRHDDGTDSEVRKRIWYALRRKGIEIPYPARNIFVTELSREREESKWQKEHEKRLKTLKKVAILAPLDDDGLDHIADRCRVEVFGQGETILRQGAPGDSLYVIRKGLVSVRLSAGGGEHEVATLLEGQLFGEMSLMTGAARTATCVAKTDCECYVIDRALFQEVLASRASLVSEISEILTKREEELKDELGRLGAQAAGGQVERHDLINRIKSFFGIQDRR
jgi:small-conductance mechanosensitive channel/CRP-like cAMP-binding protein